jgi:hypothetical protein
MERSPEASRLSQLVFLVSALLVGFFVLSHLASRPSSGLRADRDSIDLGRVSTRGKPASANVVLMNTSPGELLVSAATSSMPALSGRFLVNGREEVVGSRPLAKRGEATLRVTYDPQVSPATRGEAVHLLQLYVAGVTQAALTLQVRVIQTE